jgi:hypothetical protein
MEFERRILQPDRGKQDLQRAVNHVLPDSDSNALHCVDDSSFPLPRATR